MTRGDPEATNKELPTRYSEEPKILIPDIKRCEVYECRSVWKVRFPVSVFCNLSLRRIFVKSLEGFLKSIHLNNGLLGFMSQFLISLIVLVRSGTKRFFPDLIKCL